MKIKITAETTIDMTEEQLTRFGITTYPMKVQLGDKTYLDGVDLSAPDIYASVAANGILPKTSAISPIEYEEFFREQIGGFDALIHFSISSEISSCYQNACLAAEEVGNVYIVDTRNLSAGIALLAIEASLAAQKPDADAEKIAEECRALTEKVDVSFILGDLEYMYKGGRCSSVSMFGANLLKLRPVLEMKDGKLGVCGKMRGALPAVLKQYIQTRLKDQDVRTDRVYFTSTCVDDELPNLAKQVLEEMGMFDEILVSKAGCTVTSHCGKDTFGVLFLHK